MDSGLGQALIGGGLQGDLRQPIFSVGLKGVDPVNAAKVPRDSLIERPLPEPLEMLRKLYMTSTAQFVAELH